MGDWSVEHVGRLDVNYTAAHYSNVGYPPRFDDHGGNRQKLEKQGNSKEDDQVCTESVLGCHGFKQTAERFQNIFAVGARLANRRARILGRITWLPRRVDEQLIHTAAKVTSERHDVVEQLEWPVQIIERDEETTE